MEDKKQNKNKEKEQEQWIPVPDEPYNRTFLVSNMGQIKNKNTGQIKALMKNDSTGYYSVRLDMGKKYKKITYQIHQLVAKMFNGECPKDYFVVHKDSNKDNNSASNLTYMSKSDANKGKHKINHNKVVLTDDSESDSEEKTRNNSIQPKKVLSVKAKQKVALEKLSSKKVISDESTSDTEDINKVNIKFQEKIKLLEERIKLLEEKIDGIIQSKKNIDSINQTPPVKLDRKTINGYSRYEVDKKGNVYDKYSGKIKEPYGNEQGYLRQSLAPDGGNTSKPDKKYVHRLVAETFIPNPKNLPYVNHKNANKQDNSVENLEWCTSSENMLHASKVYKTGTKICAFDSKTGKFYKSFESIKAAGREIGVDSTTITKVISGDRLLAGGYFWKKGEYENENDISDIDEKLLDQVKKQDRYRKKKIKSESEESESE
jgi:hypothetical protein